MEDFVQVIDKLNRIPFLAGESMFITVVFTIEQSGQKVVLELWNKSLKNTGVSIWLLRQAKQN